LGAILAVGGARRKPADRARAVGGPGPSPQGVKVCQIVPPRAGGFPDFPRRGKPRKIVPWRGRSGCFASGCRLYILLYTYAHMCITGYSGSGGAAGGLPGTGKCYNSRADPLSGAHLRLGAHVQVILSAGAQRRSRNIWASSQRLTCGTKPRSLDFARDDSHTAGFPIWMHRIEVALPGSGGQNGLPVGRGFATRIG